MDARGVSIMARNIANQPHRTPNPDKPHRTPNPDKPHSAAIGAGARRGSADPGDPAPPPTDETQSQGPTYDSCFDDLNMILSQSIEQPDPDPNLESSAQAHPVRAEPAPGVVPKPKRQPRTSEIFRSVAPEALAGRAAEPESRGATAGANLVVVDRERPIADLATEEYDSPLEPRISWIPLLLLSYSSAITLALIWILWTGRESRIAEPRSSASPATAAPSRSAGRDRAAQAPPIPPENLTTLGQTVHLGDLEVTPLAVVALPLELIRSIDPAEYRREEEDSLVLRLRLTNVSRKRSLVPLDTYLTRERGLRPLDPFIATSDGSNIGLYPLAIDSEWSIAGQEFPKLEPGDTGETIVAAEPGSAHRTTSEMTWRVRLRTGVYRTDLIGVRFNQNQVRHVSSLDEAASDASP
jgi:hypothetical protein